MKNIVFSFSMHRFSGSIKGLYLAKTIQAHALSIEKIDPDQCLTDPNLLSFIPGVSSINFPALPQ